MSTPEQIKGDSKRRQLELSKDYANAHGLDLNEEEMLDIGKSAFDGSHVSQGVFGEFLRRVERGEIHRGSYLLVESLDRISREKLGDAASRIRDLVSNGIIVVTLNDGQKYDDPNDLMQILLSIVSLYRAHDESANKSKRLKELWKHKRSLAHERPMTGICPGWLRLSQDKRRFEVIEERATVVRRIFKESAEGLGAFRIARGLNEDTVPTFGRSSSGWHISSVKKILQNIATYGAYQPHVFESGERKPVGSPVADYFPAVVTYDDFQAAKRAITQRSLGGGGRTGKAQANLFKGLLWCSECRGRVVVINKGPPPKGGRYLVCEKSRRGHKCSGGSWRYIDFESTFLSWFGLTSSQRRTAALKQLREERVTSSKLLQELETDLTKKLRMAENMDIALGKVEVVSDRTIQKRQRIENEIVEIERVIAEIRESIERSKAPALPERNYKMGELPLAVQDWTNPDIELVRSDWAQAISGSFRRIDVSFAGITAYLARHAEWLAAPLVDADDDDEAASEKTSFLTDSEAYPNSTAPCFAAHGLISHLVQGCHGRPAALRFMCPLKQSKTEQLRVEFEDGSTEPAAFTATYWWDPDADLKFDLLS